MLVGHRIQVFIWFCCAHLLRQHYGFAPSIVRPAAATGRRRVAASVEPAISICTGVLCRPERSNVGLCTIREHRGACNASNQTRKQPLFCLSQAKQQLAAACTTSIPLRLHPNEQVQIEQWSALMLATAILVLQTFRVQAAQLLRQGTIWYLNQLNAFPLITKSISSGVIGVVGDYAAQWLEYRLRRKRKRRAAQVTNNDVNNNALTIHGTYDVRRGFAILLDGILISGPIMHWGYNLFEHVLPISSSLAAVIHVVADSIVLDSIFVGTAIVGTGLMEGYRLKRDIVPQLQKDYASTLKASWVTSATLLPLEFVCFRFLPVTLRTLAMNLTDVVWEGVVSFMAHKSRRRKDDDNEDDDAPFVDQPSGTTLTQF